MADVTAHMCTALPGGHPDDCRPGWRYVRDAPDLRRLLAATLADLLDDVPGGVEAHEAAHAAAVEHRARSRRDAGIDYRRTVRGAVRRQIRSTAA